MTKLMKWIKEVAWLTFSVAVGLVVIFVILALMAGCTAAERDQAWNDFTEWYQEGQRGYTAMEARRGFTGPSMAVSSAKYRHESAHHHD